MKYLLSISIGPVQDFIAAARRTRDLSFGSNLLSELSKAAAKEIIKSPDNDLIFPSIKTKSDLDPNSSITIANKLLALIETHSLKQTGILVEQATRSRLDEITNETFKDHVESFNRDKTEAQIKDLPEIYWAAVPYEEANYAQVRSDVEELLTARKNTRNFISSDEWAGSEYKSSLDGLRESVIYGHGYSKLESKGIKNNVGLCGIGLLKRLPAPTKHINSTSHIAATPLILSIAVDEKNDYAINKYIKRLATLGIDKSAFYEPSINSSNVFPYDGHILFESQFKEFFDKYNGDEKKEKIKQAEEALKNLLTHLGEPPSLSPYYAILLADGDNMGKLISGINKPERHKDLSDALRKFALKTVAFDDDFLFESILYQLAEPIVHQTRDFEPLPALTVEHKHLPCQ